MKAIRQVFVLFLVLIILLASWGSTQAQSADVQFFADTGHTVRGIFLKHYKGASDPQLLFGHPITEQITSRDGKTVQYFQRARFELVTDSLGRQSIQLTSVGQSLYQPGETQNAFNPAACQTFSTGFPVCFEFLDFYRANGGAAQFGNPISPLEYRNSLFVQSFEKARFEWRTDSFKARIAIADLGRIYFDWLGEDQAHLNAVTPTDATINPVLSIKVRAFVAKSVTRTSGAQTVYVVVQSQTKQAIQNATGKAIVRLPDGTSQEIIFSTNERGVAQFSFNFKNQKAGELVAIEITVNYQGLNSTTKTSFRIWF